jgi:hypothetical protein
MLDTSSMPEMNNYPNLKEKEEKLKMIVEQGDGRKYKWTKLDMQKFKAVAAKVIQFLLSLELSYFQFSKHFKWEVIDSVTPIRRGIAR